MALRLEDFADDPPWVPTQVEFANVSAPDLIADVRVQRLVPHRDPRGELTVLMTSLGGAGGSAPHVYVVRSEPRTIRAWVYHKNQWDRLAYTEGTFRLVLYDLRPGSPTLGRLNVLDVGEHNRVLVTIPPFVVHGVRNLGSRPASFVNMPTLPYDPARPDKSRLPHGHPGIPYVFE